MTPSSSHPSASVARLSPAMLDSVRSAVLRYANPLLVIVFGSRATGTATGDSDIDVLVVDDGTFGPQRSRRRLTGQIRRALPTTGHSVDLLLFDASELQRWGRSANHVIARALREGVVLYERPGTR